MLYANSGNPDQTPLYVASDLGLYCFLCPTKRTLDLYELIVHNIRIRRVLEPEKLKDK